MRKSNAISNYFGASADENHYVGMGSNFVGEESYLGESMFNGANVNANALPVLPQSSSKYTVNIVNTSTTDQTATIFGGSVYPTLTQPTGVTVSIRESSHDQVRSQSIANPFYVQGWRYILNSGSATQLTNEFTFLSRTAGGKIDSYTENPLTYKTANQNQTDVIDALDYSFPVTGNHYITVQINASTNVTWILFVKTAVDNSNILMNRPAVDVARGSATSKYSGTPTALVVKQG